MFSLTISFEILDINLAFTAGEQDPYFFASMIRSSSKFAGKKDLAQSWIAIRSFFSMSNSSKAFNPRTSLSCLVFPPKIVITSCLKFIELKILLILLIFSLLQTITSKDIFLFFKKVSIGNRISSLSSYSMKSLSASNLLLDPAASNIPMTFNIFL